MSRRGAIAAGALLTGALLTFAGVLMDLYRLEVALPEYQGFRLTPWQVHYRPPIDPSSDPHTPQWGYPMVLAGVLAVVAALLLFRSPRFVAVGRFAAVASAGLLVGTTWSAHATVTTLFGRENLPPSSSATLGSGMWTLTAACLVLLVGAALAQDWPPRAPEPTGVSVYRVDGDDDDTPPFGIAIPTTALDVPEVADRAAGAADGDGSGVADRGAERHPPTGGNPSTVEH
ncbi:hypothetical protein FHS29_005963 [Saccharothrix tamanrassetensis]|uniref:Uncharacterized protein n=1 Tax=Saccharothrix tamanrassetensis TaxID=1051531 RepID=A0A841CR21_9PSEU|nr:hypothetical protein [Saccharothrix tamanrassetensis]MBB5959343.1 hypothetical protein [Saccharothrix tamanrassetensis]